MEAQLQDNIKKFILAGNATFTLESSKTGTRFTYQVTPNIKDEDIIYYYVHILTGSNNTTDYTYIGAINKYGSNFNGIGLSEGKLAFQWFYNRLAQDLDVSKVNFYHAGKCARCGRKLTTPEAIKQGFGNKCFKMI